MKRIVVKLAHPAVEPDELAEQSAVVAQHLPEADVVRVSGSGRILLSVPDAGATDAVTLLSALSSVAWAELDGAESAQSDSASPEGAPPDLAEPGVPESADGDPQPS